MLCCGLIPKAPSLAVSDQVVNLSDINYPRLANLYLKAPITDAEVEQLAKWDVLVFGMQLQDSSAEQIRALRKLNPDVIILAYVAAQEFPVSRLDEIESQSGPWHKLYSGIQPEWWLYTSTGERFSSWPGNYSLNMASAWNTYLPTFMQNEVMSTGLWDGIYYDNVWETVSWVGNGDMDMNRDGVQDSVTSLDEAWYNGMVTMLKTSRQLVGKNKFLLGNGGSGYKKYLNGRMFESFPNVWLGAWDNNFELYNDFQNKGYVPALIMINGDTNNSGNDKDYQDMRFAITSTLLNDGFFSYDWGTNDHSQLWWYDEYDAALGQSQERAYNILDKANPTKIQAGVWRRNFERGIVLLNSTDKEQKVLLEDGFEKILGTQDTNTNNGKVVGSVTIPAHDGIILRGRITQVVNAPFVNGTYAKVFDGAGNIKRNSFFSYNSNYVGSTTIQKIPDANITVVSDNTYITVYKNNKQIARFAPYGTKYNSGVNIAVGQLSLKNKKYNIVVGAQRGTQPVKLFSLKGKPLNKGSYPFGNSFSGGINVAIGNVQRKTKAAEIIVAPASNYAPEVRILTKKMKLLSKKIMAYNASMRSGISVAAGDVDNNGKVEIITVPGTGGVPYVKVFNSRGKLLRPGYYAFSKSDRSGSKVTASDIDGDNVADVVVMSFNIFNQ
ncbi:MAG: putative glycoside hydrolase [Patescibacteria group bacterium]|jgi:hypothetical protein